MLLYVAVCMYVCVLSRVYNIHFCTCTVIKRRKRVSNLPIHVRYIECVRKSYALGILIISV